MEFVAAAVEQCDGVVDPEREGGRVAVLSAVLVLDTETEPVVVLEPVLVLEDDVLAVPVTVGATVFVASGDLVFVADDTGDLEDRDEPVVVAEVECEPEADGDRVYEAEIVVVTVSEVVWRAVELVAMVRDAVGDSEGVMVGRGLPDTVADAAVVRLLSGDGDADLEEGRDRAGAGDGVSVREINGVCVIGGDAVCDTDRRIEDVWRGVGVTVAVGRIVSVGRAEKVGVRVVAAARLVVELAEVVLETDALLD